MLKDNVKRKIKKMVQTAFVGTLIAGGVSCGENKNDKDNIVKPQTEVVKPKPVKKVTSPVVKIAYRTDTLDNPTSVLLYYYNHSITRNFLENNESFRLQLPYFAHENHHHTNDNLKFKFMQFSPEEALKLRMHDEISANLTAILTARYEYLAAENKSAVIKKYEKSYMKFYFEAIKNKKINPESNAEQDRNAEWKLLANGTRKMWMRKFSVPYAARLGKSVKNYIAVNGLSDVETHRKYEYICRKMYNIGGVDFWSYMDEDISNKDNVIAIAEEMRKSSNLKNKELVAHLNSFYPLMENVGNDNGRAVLQHIFISGMLKEKLKGVDAENLRTHPQIVASCYNQIFGALKSDEKFAEIIDDYSTVLTPAEMKRNSAEYDELIGRLYQHNGVDLRKVIENFNNENLPVDVSINADWLQMNAENNFDRFVAAENMDVERIKTVKFFPESTEFIAKKTPEKHRYSEELSIELPNFEDNILVACTPQQNAEIISVMQEFEKIPAVLKGCNLKAQQKYLRTQQKKQKTR